MDPNGKRLRDWETLRTSSTAKFIRKNHKLAFGSNSVIFSHNAVSELLRVYTVSAEVAHSDPLTLFHTFPILHILFFWTFATPFQYMTQSFPRRAALTRLLLFAAFPPPGPVPGKLRPPPREINKVKQVRLFLSWKHKNLDSYPIPRAVSISVVVLGSEMSALFRNASSVWASASLLAFLNGFSRQIMT